MTYFLNRRETARLVSGFLLCAILVTGPLAAKSQTVTVVKNVTKTITKTVNVNGNGVYKIKLSISQLETPNLRWLLRSWIADSTSLIALSISMSFALAIGVC